MTCCLHPGLMGGRKAELDLGMLLQKKLTVCGAVLRSRSKEEKELAVERFRQRWLPALEEGVLEPLMDSTFPVRERPCSFFLIFS